uniref:Uncharacterized protein n=1 Tax=Oryzias sinensis TaxID=183150 RepID=A0A8C7ZYA2_9TELE
MQAEMNTPTPETQFCSTTHRDFCIPGYEPSRPKAAQVCLQNTHAKSYTHTSTHTHAHTVRQCSRRKDTKQQKHKNPFKNMHTFDDGLSYNLNTVNLSLLQNHDYKTEQAITFWSENYQQVQGVTPVQNQKAPFRRSALFSTPLSERLNLTFPSTNCSHQI